MTTAYATALERAQAAGLSVVASGTGATDGRRYLFVCSERGGPDGDWHRVWADNSRLQCSCHGGRHGKVCMHKAVAREVLKSEQHEQAALARAEAEQRVPRDVAARSVRFAPGPGRTTSCSTCAVPFEDGELIDLVGRYAYHPACRRPATLMRSAGPVTPWKE
jgi:hypothetical protein